jgi:two-component system, OmpR family, sensor histidine kinase KdpD
MASVTSLIDGRGFSEQERGEHLDTIKQEAERLHRVVNNLLDVARLRTGALVPVKLLSPIDELMESVINRLRPLLDKRPIDLRIGDDVPEVPMDVVQIDQVLTNLIENAVKFTPSDSSISLAAVGSNEVVRVTVTDRGPGVPREDRVRIFEPFERAEQSGSGTGLGLAISNAIIVAHGGRMWVSDNPAGGCIYFRIALHLWTFGGGGRCAKEYWSLRMTPRCSRQSPTHWVHEARRYSFRTAVDHDGARTRLPLAA